MAERNDSGAVVEFGRVELSDIRVGDCLVGNQNVRQVTAMEAIPCTDVHIYETFAVFDIERSGEYPGSTTDDLATRGCLARWVRAVGTVYEDDTELDVSYVYPYTRAGLTATEASSASSTTSMARPLLETRLDR